MPRPKIRKPALRSRLRPRVKVWFEADDHYSFGFGLIEILQTVARAGSIKQAAVDLGRSYRHVWGRIKEAERALGQPLVETRIGGQSAQRSELTDAARQIVADFLRLRGRLIAFMDREFARRPI